MGLSYEFLAASTTGSVDLTRSAALAEAQAIVERLYPRTPYEHIGTDRLPAVADQPRGRLAVGVFEEGVLVSSKDAHLYDPAILDRRYLKLGEWPDLRLLTSRSDTNMFAYGRWRAGALTRSLSVNAVAGVWCDAGEPEDFEGGHVVSADRCLELSNAALARILRLEGDAAPAAPDAVDCDDVELHVFARADR